MYNYIKINVQLLSLRSYFIFILLAMYKIFFTKIAFLYLIIKLIRTYFMNLDQLHVMTLRFIKVTGNKHS